MSTFGDEAEVNMGKYQYSGVDWGHCRVTDGHDVVLNHTTAGLREIALCDPVVDSQREFRQGHVSGELGVD
jgi:hypothetical protein